MLFFWSYQLVLRRFAGTRSPARWPSLPGSGRVTSNASLGTSTASLGTSTASLGTSTASLGTSTASLGTSTASLGTSTTGVKFDQNHPSFSGFHVKATQRVAVHLDLAR